MSDLRERALAYNRELKAVLSMIWAELNQGQRKKLLRNPMLAALLARYGVDIEEA